MKQSAQNKSGQTHSPNKNKYSAPALEKGLDILELLAQHSESVTLSEIAKELNRSVGEIFRMLAVLEQREYVAIGPNSDRYSLTLKLFEIVHSNRPIKRLTAISAPVMQKLARSTGQSCHISIPDGPSTLVITQEDAHSDRSFGLRVGAKAPFFESCSGNVLFAFSDSAARTRIWEEVELASGDAHDWKSVTNTAEKIFARGFYKIDSQQVSGVVDIGFPIFDQKGTIVAAFVVPFLKRRDNRQKTSVDEARKLLNVAAQEISTAMGSEIAVSAS